MIVKMHPAKLTREVTTCKCGKVVRVVGKRIMSHCVPQDCRQVCEHGFTMAESFRVVTLCGNCLKDITGKVHNCEQKPSAPNHYTIID